MHCFNFSFLMNDFFTEKEQGLILETVMFSKRIFYIAIFYYFFFL